MEFVVDFISLEEAAEQLDIPDSLLRQWVKKGFARASRRGGSYVLRTSEVERLQRNPSPEMTVSMELEAAAARPIRKPEPEANAEDGSTHDEPAAKIEEVPVQRPRVLPPRPRSEENWQVQDRRKRNGRRGTDFSLESLHNEVRLAVEEALDVLDGRIDRFHETLESTLRAHRSSAQDFDGRQAEQLERLERLAEKLVLPAPNVVEIAVPAPADTAELDELRQRVNHLEEVREEFRSRLEDSEKRRVKAESDLDRRARDWDTALHSRSSEYEATASELAEKDSALRSAQENLERERQRNEEIEKALQKNQENLRQSRAENDQLRSDLESLQAVHSSSASNQGLLEQERSRQLEILSSELSELRRAHARSEAYSADLQEKLDDANRALDSAQARSRETEIGRDLEQQQLKSLEVSLEAHRQREEELNQEVRRYKEQVTGLQFKLQMQTQGGATGSVDDSRKQMERLAEMEAQMFEKDRLINQSYRELSELRGKLEEQQRVFYELQQHTEKEKEEWSQVVAQQLRVAGELTHQRQLQQPAAPAEKSRWGLFKARGDAT